MANLIKSFIPVALTSANLLNLPNLAQANTGNEINNHQMQLPNRREQQISLCNPQPDFMLMNNTNESQTHTNCIYFSEKISKPAQERLKQAIDTNINFIQKLNPEFGAILNEGNIEIRFTDDISEDVFNISEITGDETLEFFSQTDHYNELQDDIGIFGEKRVIFLETSLFSDTINQANGFTDEDQAKINQLVFTKLLSNITKLKIAENLDIPEGATMELINTALVVKDLLDNINGENGFAAWSETRNIFGADTRNFAENLKKEVLDHLPIFIEDLNFELEMEEKNQKTPNILQI